MIQAAIRSILLNDPAVKGIVGTRMFPLELSLDCSLPALSYSRVSNPYKQVAGIPRFQVSCWSEDYLECHNLAKAVIGALEGYAGIVNSVNIIRIIPIDAPDLFEAGTGVFHIPCDFKVIYRK